MLFTDLPVAASVFLDANVLVYHFGPHPLYGPACHQLVQRIGNQELLAFTSTAVLGEAAHHLMTLEASALFCWSSKVVQRLKQNAGHVQQLTQFRWAI